MTDQSTELRDKIIEILDGAEFIEEIEAVENLLDLIQSTVLEVIGPDLEGGKQLSPAWIENQLRAQQRSYLKSIMGE